MDRSKLTKIIVSGVIILAAAVLIIRSAGGEGSLNENHMESALEAMPTDEIITMRQSLAAQIAEANRTRSGEKSEMLLGFEATLEDYDRMLRERGTDPDTLETPSLAQMPQRHGEEP